MSDSAQGVPVVELAEWSTKHARQVVLAAEDRYLLAQWANDGNRRLIVEELRDGVRIQSRSWVGVVRLSSLEVRVIPKLAGEHLGLLQMLDYTFGLDALRQLDAKSSPELKGNSLFELVVLLFVLASERLVRRGILSDYQAVESDLPVIRGRFLADRQIMNRFGNLSRLECRFDEQVSNIPENQLILAGLTACRSQIRSLDLLQRINRLDTYFRRLCSLRGNPRDLIRIPMIYNRLNEHYREAHQFAVLLLESLVVSDLFGRDGVRCFAFLLDMNFLFERFVTKWISDLLYETPYSAIPQRRDGSVLWNLETNKSYRGVVPDILVEHRKRAEIRLPIDSKYKLYDNLKVSMDDIYQTFLYASAFTSGNPEHLPQACILYPASSSSFRITHLAVRRANNDLSAKILAIGIHLPSVLKECQTKVTSEFGNFILQAIERHFNNVGVAPQE